MSRLNLAAAALIAVAAVVAAVPVAAVPVEIETYAHGKCNSIVLNLEDAAGSVESIAKPGQPWGFKSAEKTPEGMWCIMAA